MVVGCGALGNEVLKNLAMMGIGHILVVDFDVVEADNLSRSVLFTRDDALSGRRKAEVASERLRAINPMIEVTPLCGDIAYDVGLGIIRQMDVVIGCVDNRWARFCINRLCLRAGKPWVDGGIDGLEGTARVFIPGQNCYACNLGPEGQRDLAYRMPCAGTVRRNIAAGKASTTSITASIIGAVQVQEALKLLHQEALSDDSLTSLVGRMFCYEGEHLTTRTVDFKGYDDDCPEHELWDPIITTPMTNAWTVRDALSWMGSDACILLMNDCFVDYLALRSDDSRVEVMRPGRAVEAFVEQDDRLKGIPLSGLYQHEFREIDVSFPWQDLTLAELGVPERDILCVQTDGRICYYELVE